MSDQTNTTPAAPEGKPTRCGRRGPGRALMIAAVAIAGIAAGAAATKAFTHGMGRMSHHGMGGIHHVAGPMGGLVGGPVDPAQAEERATRMAKHFAIEIDATPEQQAKLVTIATAAAKDLLPLREKVQGARKQGLDILAAPTVDRAALEALRNTQMVNADQASRRISQALADVAEVLTPDQRKKLAAKIEERRERRGWWGHGRGKEERKG